jgi:hypothetical protein
MLTRRAALRIGLGIPAAFAAAQAHAAVSREFWNNKPPSEWTHDEIQELLNRSPWAKDASVSYDGGPGGASAGRTGRIGGGGGFGGRRGGYGGNPGAVGRIPGSPQSGPVGDDQLFKSVVRWESALPVREATHAATTDKIPDWYVIALIGDLPIMGGPANEDEDGVQNERRLEMLRQYTKIEKKGDPIFLSKAEPTPKGSSSGSGTLFYFPRTDSILVDDKQVTFVTKFGPYEAKARFTLKDMLYHGRLEL